MENVVGIITKYWCTYIIFEKCQCRYGYQFRITIYALLNGRYYSWMLHPRRFNVLFQRFCILSLSIRMTENSSLNPLYVANKCKIKLVHVKAFLRSLRNLYFLLFWNIEKYETLLDFYIVYCFYIICTHISSKTNSAFYASEYNNCSHSPGIWNNKLGTYNNKSFPRE